MINPPRSLKRNFTWMFTGRVVYMTSQWGILVIIARLADPLALGQFTLALAVTAPVMLFAGMQMRHVQATDARDEYSFSDYLGVRILATALAYVTVAVIVGLNYDGITAVIILMIGIAKSAELLSDITYGLMQRHERLDQTATSLLIKGPLSLVFTGLVLWLTGSIVAGTAAMAVSWIALLVFYDLRIARRLSSITPRFTMGVLTRLAILTFPLGLAKMLLSLETNIPRYVIESVMGLESLGYYAAVAYLLLAGNAVLESLANTVTPRLAAYHAEGRTDAYLRLLKKSMGVGLVTGLAGVIAAMAVGRPVLGFLYGPEYEVHAGVLVLIMVAGLVRYTDTFLTAGLMAVRWFTVQTGFAACAAAASLGASLLLVPQFGLKGAAGAIILSSLTQFGVKFILLRRYLATRNKGAANE